MVPVTTFYMRVMYIRRDDFPSGDGSGASMTLPAEEAEEPSEAPEALDLPGTPAEDH